MEETGIVIEDGSTLHKKEFLDVYMGFFTANPEDPDGPILTNHPGDGLLEVAACLARLGVHE